MRFFGVYVLFKNTQVQWLVRGGFIAMHSLYKRCRSKRTWRLKWKRWSPCNVRHLDVIFICISKDHHIIYLQFDLAKRMNLQCGCDGFVCQQHCGCIHLQYRKSYDQMTNDQKEPLFTLDFWIKTVSHNSPVSWNNSCSTYMVPSRKLTFRLSKFSWTTTKPFAPKGKVKWIEQSPARRNVIGR